MPRPRVSGVDPVADAGVLVVPASNVLETGCAHDGRGLEDHPPEEATRLLLGGGRCQADGLPVDREELRFPPGLHLLDLHAVAHVELGQHLRVLHAPRPQRNPNTHPTTLASGARGTSPTHRARSKTPLPTDPSHAP
jgi:hypothetical protein